jgi:hypothetical protein
MVIELTMDVNILQVCRWLICVPEKTLSTVTVEAGKDKDSEMKLKRNKAEDLPGMDRTLHTS